MALVRQVRGHTPGTVAVGLMKGYGVNLSPAAYYSQIWPFINMVRSGGGWTSGTSVDAITGWLVALADGAHNSRAICFSQDVDLGYFPPGDYLATTASGCFCSFDQGAGYGAGGCTNIVDGTDAAHPSCTFTVPALSDGLGISVVIKVSNSSGAAKNVNDLYVGLASSKTLYDAGKFWDPRFLADLAGVKHVRIQGWVGQNVNVDDSLDTSLFNELTNALWLSDYVGYQMPYEAAADLAKELNCVLWLCLNTGDRRLVYDYNHTTNTFTSRDARAGGAPSITPHLFIENEPLALFGYRNEVPTGFSFDVQYYAHILTSSTFQLKATSGGSIVTGSTDLPLEDNTYGRAVGQVYTAAQMQTYYTAVFNRIKTYWTAAGFDGVILPEVSNEPWNVQYSWNYFHGSPSISAGSAQNSGPGWAWLQMNAIKSADGVFGASKVVAASTGQAVWFDGFGRSALAYVDAQNILGSGGTQKFSDILAARGGYYYTDSYIFPSLSGQDSSFPPQMYSGSSWPGGDNIENSGQYAVNDLVHMTDGHDYKCKLLHTPDGTNVPPNATYWTDLGAVLGVSGGALTWTDAQWELVWKRGIDRLITLTGGQLAQMTAAAPGLKIMSYEGGNGFGMAFGSYDVNNANTVARQMSFMATANATNVIDYYRDAMMGPLGFAAHTQYTAAGGWTLGGGGANHFLFCWGLKRAHQLADNVWGARMKLRLATLGP